MSKKNLILFYSYEGIRTLFKEKLILNPLINKDTLDEENLNIIKL